MFECACACVGRFFRYKASTLCQMLLRLHLQSKPIYNKAIDGRMRARRDCSVLGSIFCVKQKSFEPLHFNSMLHFF